MYSMYIIHAASIYYIYLFIFYSCRTPLHAAAFTDHVECLQLLLAHNAQVNCVDSCGKTPLMMAAENGQTNAVGKASPNPVRFYPGQAFSLARIIVAKMNCSQ